MNTHKHARLTFLRRLEMVQQLIAHQVCVPEAARAYGVTAPTVRKWLGRFLAQGQAGLPMRPRARRVLAPDGLAPSDCAGQGAGYVELRRKRLTQARIASLGVSPSTVSRVLARAGLSHLADLEPAEGARASGPGDLLHIDIKKLGRIQRPGTGSRATDAIPLRGPAGTSSSWAQLHDSQRLGRRNRSGRDRRARGRIGQARLALSQEAAQPFAHSRRGDPIGAGRFRHTNLMGDQLLDHFEST
ncbi:transposase, IS481 family [Bordetella pertussis H939]|nr:transposase, IS481 family [Bordetella pertussis H939]